MDTVTLPKYAYLKNGVFIPHDAARYDAQRFGGASHFLNVLGRDDLTAFAATLQKAENFFAKLDDAGKRVFYKKAGFSDSYGEVLLLREGEVQLPLRKVFVTGENGTEYIFVDPHQLKFDPGSTRVVDQTFGQLRWLSFDERTGRFYFGNGIPNVNPSCFYDFETKSLRGATNSKVIKISALLPFLDTIPAEYFDEQPSANQKERGNRSQYYLEAFFMLYMMQNITWFFKGFEFVKIENPFATNPTDRFVYFPINPKPYLMYLKSIKDYRPELLVAAQNPAYYALPAVIESIQNDLPKLSPIMKQWELDEIQATIASGKVFYQEKMDSWTGDITLAELLKGIALMYSVYSFGAGMNMLSSPGSVTGIETAGAASATDIATLAKTVARGARIVESFTNTNTTIPVSRRAATYASTRAVDTRSPIYSAGRELDTGTHSAIVGEQIVKTSPPENAGLMGILGVIGFLLFS